MIHVGYTYNGLIMLAIIIAALLSLSSCGIHRATETGQIQTIIKDTLYIKQSDEKTQKDTFQRFLHVFNDTVTGGVRVVEKIYHTSTTLHDTIFLQATKQDTLTRIMLSNNGSKENKNYLLSLIISLIVVLIFSVCALLKVKKQT